MFLQSFSGILPPNSDENQKKISTEFWFYLSPEFRFFAAKWVLLAKEPREPDIFRPL